MKPTFIALCLCLPLMGAEKKKERFEKTKALAEKGDLIAQYNLGVIYRDGEGVLKDFKEAVKWFRKAAEQGYDDAQVNLGAMYANGNGVPQDNLTAYAWWNIADSNGQELAKKYKDIIAGRMTPDQITKAEALVEKMIKKNPKLLNK